MSWPWNALGLDGPADLGAVKHAYAQKLKLTHPEEDPEGFQQLHAAYQAASRIARQRKKREKPWDICLRIRQGMKRRLRGLP